jgi:hypothetical protein
MVPLFRMSGAIPLLHHTYLQRGQDNLILLVHHCNEESNAVSNHLKNIDVSSANCNFESALETA